MLFISNVVSTERNMMIKKPVIIFIAGLLFIGCCSLQAQDEEPEPRLLVSVTLKSYTECVSNFVNVVNAVVPGMGMMVQQRVPQIIGSPVLQGIDRDKPVYVYIGFIAKDLPGITGIFIPVTDFGAFRTGLQETSFLKKTKFGPNHIEQTGEYALVVMNIQKDTQNGLFKATDYISSFKKWRSENEPHHMISVVMRVEPVRDALLAQIQQARKTIVPLLAMISGAQAGAADPESIKKILGIYFEALQALVTGIDNAVLNFDMNDQKIIVQTVAHPVKGGPTEKYFAPPESDIKKIIGLANSNAQLMYAGILGDKTPIMAEFKKIIPLSLKMQGLDGETAGKMNELINTSMDLMIPCLFMGALDISPEGFAVEYAIKLDEKRASGFCEQLGLFYKDIEKLAGPDKLYKKIEYRKDVRKVEGMPVDRLTLEYNMDHPQAAMLKQAGIGALKEMIFEYTTVGDTVVMASPSKFDALVQKVRKGGNGSSITVRDNTVLKGSLNIVECMKGIMGVITTIPPHIKNICQGMPSAGTAIECDLVLNNTADIKMTIPVQLLKTAGMLFLQIKTLQQGMQPGKPPVGPVPPPVF